MCSREDYFIIALKVNHFNNQTNSVSKIHNTLFLDLSRLSTPESHLIKGFSRFAHDPEIGESKISYY